MMSQFNPIIFIVLFLVIVKLLEYSNSTYIPIITLIANHIFLLLFKCKLKIHQTNSEDTHLDEEVIKVLSEAYGPEGIPTISILDEVLLGWIDVYMEYCLYSKQWDMIFLLHDGLLQALVTSHQGNLRTNEAIDFKLPRHLVIDKVAATLPLYQHLLTGNLVFPILISLYIAIGYEYCTTILNWKSKSNNFNNLINNNLIDTLLFLISLSRFHYTSTQ
ncbi:hypothetical protein K502DRAFT_193590 [Neoconidiobolus thromboides FSU 785]|nr:hypothetical protein K502DRAFT_193590 [Neoconidiobolus thromboides FSU 785]